jgi:RIO kinase 1
VGSAKRHLDDHRERVASDAGDDEWEGEAEKRFDLETRKEEAVGSKEEHWYAVVERKLSGLPRPEGKDRRTWDGVFDNRTLMTLYRLFSTGVLDAMDFPVSTGKEADVFRASTPEGTLVCVKIYRVAKATFHNMLPYIQGDPRFQGIKRDKLSMVTAWAQKEYRNLGRAVEVGARVPQPILCLNNVLVMEYVGTEEGPYPLLKDVELEPEDWPEVLQELLESYHRFFVKGRLVHADLSEYNIIMTPDGPVMIDTGQAVVLDHPMAQEFFDKDVRNLAKFFQRQGVRTNEKEVRDKILGGKHFEDHL